MQPGGVSGKGTCFRLVLHGVAHAGLSRPVGWLTDRYLGGIPAEAEELALGRDLGLAKLTGVHFHALHVSTAGSVELIRRAKAEGLTVTAEATPHHLTLTDEACRHYDTRTKVIQAVGMKLD